MDGKHCRIKNPYNSSRLFVNYKKFFSIILLAVANANAEFIWVNIRVNGACFNAQV